MPHEHTDRAVKCDNQEMVFIPLSPILFPLRFNFVMCLFRIAMLETFRRPQHFKVKDCSDVIQLNPLTISVIELMGASINSSSYKNGRLHIAFVLKKQLLHCDITSRVMFDLPKYRSKDLHLSILIHSNLMNFCSSYTFINLSQDLIEMVVTVSGIVSVEQSTRAQFSIRKFVIFGVIFI